MAGKAVNKKVLQKKLNLKPAASAPLFFWPSRLDPHQKGGSLLADILPQLIKRHGHDGLQIVFVANGEYQPRFHAIVRANGLHKNVAVCNFSEELSRLAYAASDFVLMPSLFEPCGLPQMISCKYGSLPVAHDTGGIHDTISRLDFRSGTGNGFLFENYDSNGLSRAIEQALVFYKLPKTEREEHLARIMRESAGRFTHSATASAYISLYERMLSRPLV
jgi:glycogen synthase